jgi:hypothetical protein
MSRTMPSMLVWFIASCRMSRSRSVMRRFTTSANNVAIVMKPSPPIWINARMMSWPTALKKVPVSATTSPVTQTADVAVKTASMKRIGWPSAETAGSDSRQAPSRMIRANPAASTRGGDQMAASFCFIGSGSLPNGPAW